MAFGTETQEFVEEVAELAAQMYGMYGAAPRGMDWSVIITIALSLIQQLCKPKTEAARQTFLKNLAKKISTNGVAGCCDDCLTPKAAKKWRERLAKRGKIKNRAQQDQVLHVLAMASVTKMEAAVGAMTSASENDEDDDETN